MRYLTLILFFTSHIIIFSDEIKHYHTDSIHIESARIIKNFPLYDISDSTLLIEDKHNIRQLTGTIPGLFISDYGSRTSGGLYYRGLGNRHNGSGVVIYVDGVPLINGIESGINLTDVGEIYLGKQGISVSGLGDIYITSKSVLQPGTDVLLSFGNANTGRVELTHNGSIKDIYYGVVASGYRSDGFVTNSFNNSLGDSRVEYSIIFKLDFQLTQAIHNQTRFSFSYLTENAFQYRLFSDDVLFDFAVNDENTYKNKVLMIIENLDFIITDKLKFNSISSFTFFQDEMCLDQDFSIKDYFSLNQKQRRRVFTEEAKFIYDHD